MLSPRVCVTSVYANRWHVHMSMDVRCLYVPALMSFYLSIYRLYCMHVKLVHLRLQVHGYMDGRPVSALCSSQFATGVVRGRSVAGWRHHVPCPSV